MSATVVEELRRVWGGVRVDDVRAVDRVLRTGTSRGAVEVASYVFASDPSLRRVAAGRRGLPGVFVDVLAGDSNEGVVVALLRALTVWAMKRWLRRSGGIACGRRRC